jgi:hypothetical protein
MNYENMTKDALIHLLKAQETMKETPMYPKWDNDFSDQDAILEMRIQKYIVAETEKMLKEIHDKWQEKDIYELPHETKEICRAIKNAKFRDVMVPLGNSGVTPPQQPDIKVD